jgi:hypothetical protein
MGGVMSKLKLGIILAVLATTSTAAAAEFYKLENLKRSGQDTYTTDTHVIKTRYCYEHTYGERATLKWIGPGEYTGNKLIFQSGTVCDVKALIRKTSSSRKCNSNTGNTAADIVNNAQCRNIQAQIANQRHDRELDHAQGRLDALNRQLAADRAQFEAFKKQGKAQQEALRKQAEATRARASQYQRIANYIRSENDRIAKIKNPKKRAAASKKLRREITAIQAELAKSTRTKK